MTARVRSRHPPAWWGAVASILDPSDDSLAMLQHSLACDLLNFYNWTGVARTLTSRGEFAAAMDTASRGLDVLPHRQIADELFAAYVATGQFDAALATSQRFIDAEPARDVDRLGLAAAQGDAVAALAIRNKIDADPAAEPLSLAVAAVMGDRAEANRLAALADAQPLGFLKLLDHIGQCYCGAPFDLEVTPNFARLVGEANLPWPPSSPIKWPLKDW
ncbi:MAG: hypothetical protein O2805_12515 [Proteobacteria bacterium]|nr:hypothetical protein [Pseudomonadota bacterium]